MQATRSGRLADTMSGRWRLLALAMLTSAAVGTVGVVGVASAASPCGASGVFSTAGPTATCTYTSAGQDMFTVPAGSTACTWSPSAAWGAELLSVRWAALGGTSALI